MPKEIPPHIEDYGTSPIRGKINTALNQIKWVLAYMHDVQEVKLPAALQMLAAAKQLRRYARALEKTVDEAAIAEMQMNETRHYAGEGFEALLHSGGARSEWQDESIVNEVADRFVVRSRDRFSEVSGRDLRRIAQGAMNELVFAGRVEWRSRALKKMDIDPDEFSVKLPGSMSVELTGEASYVEREYWREEPPHGR